jgi:cytochrome P450
VLLAARNACRQQLTARIQQTLSSPDCSGPLARLRDEFGADSPVSIDNTITMLFAGFDTTSSSITYMLWLLAQHPEVVEKVRPWLGHAPDRPAIW